MEASENSNAKNIYILYTQQHVPEKETTNEETNHTQIYKNMPLGSYQQLRTVGALFTEKRQYIPVFTTLKIHKQAITYKSMTVTVI